MNQRWRARRDSYRPAGEPIQTRAYEVAAIADDNTPKAFVTKHHYAASYPAARFRFGLYRHGDLVGVAVFSHPVNNAVLTNVFPVPANDATELGRFVLLDDVPGNGETWFLARCFDQLRGEVAGVVSFSDPVRRLSAAGKVVMPGHVGTIYQAFNGVYLGRGRADTLRLLPDGTVFNRRAISKVRARDQGWRYSAAILERNGAPPAPANDTRAWLDEWMPRLTRPLRHPGNHRYAWALDRRLRRHLHSTAAYPKRDQVAA
jgi:hypothetical protein